MGGLCSKSTVSHKKSSHYNSRVNYYGSGGGIYQPHKSVQSNEQSKLTPLHVQESVEKTIQEPMQIKESNSFRESEIIGYESSEDEFYDGIPRYPRALSQKSRSMRSRQAPSRKVSEKNSRLGRAGTLGLGRAVEVLDTLGSSMANLNSGSGFVSGPATKGNELSVLAFEVANTIVKGYSLLQSLSKRSIRQLKEVVLPSEGVQHLVSNDMDELLRIVATDKREELKIFSGEVIRFGNRCKDPQWHNLDRYFEKHSREPPKQSREEADTVMQQLMTLVQCTAELYHELQMLDILEQNHPSKLHEEDNLFAIQKGDGLAHLRGDLKGQKKKVRNLKKKSLWSRSMEEVMASLVDIVLFLNQEIHNAFGTTVANTPLNGSLNIQQRLGPAGLALHYANIVLQIDSMVAKSNAMPPNTRDTLYQSLPPSIKSSLRSKLQSFHVKEELSVIEIKAEMEKTLQWLVPVAANTAKAHHGFGWVGEWANTRSEVNRKSNGLIDIIRIDTLHHADKGKTEGFILELVLWLNHLISQSKVAADGGGTNSPIKSPLRITPQETNQQPTHEAASDSSSLPSVEDQGILQDISERKRIRGISKSQDFESMKDGLKKHDKLSKSTGHSSTTRSNDSLPAKEHSSSIPVGDSSHDKEKAMDVIDGVDTQR